MTTLTNPGPRGRYATIEGTTYGTDEPGGKVHTSNALHATCLVEAGFVMDPAEYEAALDAATDKARAENSAAASASASEGSILTRQEEAARQATVDVESGATTGVTVDAGQLKGEALKAALTERGLPQNGTADERRAAVAMYDVARSSGLYRVDESGLLELDSEGGYVKVDEGDGFQRDDDGELVLDEDGSPIPVDNGSGSSSS